MDLFSPVRLPRPAFEHLTRLADEAITTGELRLALHEDTPYRELLPQASSSLDLSATGLEDPLREIVYFDQIMFFAFENAPSDVITDWANSFSGAAVQEAISRVQFVRENMPNTFRLWQEKSTSIVPPLTGFRYDIVHEGTPERAVTLYMSATRVDTFGRPDKSDISRFRVQLWPDDLAFIIDSLSHAREQHMEPAEPNNGD